MENIFLISAIIASVFFLVKFIEMRFIIKEARTVKSQLRDGILVYISAIVALFIYDNISESNKVVSNVDIPAFTGMPGF
jgi:hypothetical protein